MGGNNTHSRCKLAFAGWPSLFRLLSTALLLTSLCSATDVRDHLVGVQRSTVHFSFPPRVEQVQGSGICINESCSVVATAYHTQMLVGRANLRVTNGHTDKILSLANESDTNKSYVTVGKRTLYYNTAKDVSFIYTRKPLRHKSGIPYSYKCYVGQKVVVAGYYHHQFETKEARIVGSNVPIVIGRAQLKENLVLDIQLSPGTSGSAVLDERGNLLGMIALSGALQFRSGDLEVSVALPVTTIAKALVKLDPVLGSAIFNDIPEEGPKAVQTPPVLYQEDDLPADTSPVIPELLAVSREVPNPVGKLRAKSEAASKLMVNFVTKQCLAQGTTKSICHELSIVEGQQTFREIDKNGKLGKRTRSFPIPKHGVWTQSDWTDTLGEIADNPWVFQGSVGNYYLFTFKSAAEDDRCYYEEYPQGTPLFGGGRAAWKGSVGCFEQILTDKDFNVVSVFTEFHPPDDCLTQLFQTAIYYDWIRLERLGSPILLPVKERITAKVLGQKDLWYANVSWTDYKEFRADHKIKF
jgi:Trypsin-like peptidase domain